MRNVGASLDTHYQSNSQSLALCVKITRRDGVVVSFTDHDSNLVVAAVTYRASVGCQVSGLRFASVLDKDTFLIEGLMVGLSTAVEESDSIVGLYSNALVEVFEVNWADLTMGTRPVKRGRVAQVSPKGSFYSMEVESLPSLLLRTNIIESYSADCNADFGDTRCGATPATHVGTITGVIDAVTIVASAFGGPATVGFFRFGKIVINSIPWAVNQIKEYNSGTKTFTLALPLPLIDSAPSIGDSFTAHQGCDKKYTSCRDTHLNLVNFRGFPFIPQKKDISKTANIVPGVGYLAEE